MNRLEAIRTAIKFFKDVHKEEPRVVFIGIEEAAAIAASLPEAFTIEEYTLENLTSISQLVFENCLVKIVYKQTLIQVL